MIRLILLLIAFSSPAMAESMQFSLLTRSGAPCTENCPVIAAEGEITAETPAAFQALDVGNAETLVLHSTNGSVEPALELGRLIHERRLSTRIGKLSEGTFENGICKGACAWSFLGGTRRHLVPGQLVFERPNHMAILTSLTSREVTAQDRLGEQIVTGILVNYLSEMAVSSQLYARVAQIRAGAALALSEEEAKDLYVLRDLPGWQLKNWGTGLVLFVPASQGQPGVRAFCHGAARKVRLQFAMESAEIDPAGRDHKACIGSRCLSSAELGNSETSLELDTGRFQQVLHYGGIYSDPMELQQAVMDFQIDEATLTGLIQGEMVSVSGPAVPPQNLSLLQRELAPSNDMRLLDLVLSNCV